MTLGNFVSLKVGITPIPTFCENTFFLIFKVDWVEHQRPLTETFRFVKSSFSFDAMPLSSCTTWYILSVHSGRFWLRITHDQKIHSRRFWPRILHIFYCIIGYYMSKAYHRYPLHAIKLGRTCLKSEFNSCTVSCFKSSDIKFIKLWTSR